MKDIYILGIESSCDETSCSIVKNGREELSTSTSSQYLLPPEETRSRDSSRQLRQTPEKRRSYLASRPPPPTLPHLRRGDMHTLGMRWSRLPGLLALSSLLATPAAAQTFSECNPLNTSTFLTIRGAKPEPFATRLD